MHKQSFSSVFNEQFPPKLLIVAPTSRELGNGHKVLPIKGVHWGKLGIGHVAIQNLELLLNEFSPGIIISMGFAGATVEKLATGSIVVCTNFICEEGGAQIADQSILSPHLIITRQISNAVFGPLLTVKRPLLTPEAKQFAGEKSGALAADMEGYDIAKIAYTRGIPLISIRVILDELHYKLPSLVDKIISDKNGHEWRHIIKSINVVPKEVFKLIGLAFLARKAQKSLAKALSDMRYELEKYITEDGK